MKEEKTYYEKILVSSGEVPEVTGYYHFFRKNDKNKVEFLKFIAKSQSDKEWFRKHMSAWLKPVPSPKQEAMELELSKIDETIILGCISGNVGYALPSDCIKAKNEIVEFLKSKFKEKGEK